MGINKKELSFLALTLVAGSLSACGSQAYPVIPNGSYLNNSNGYSSQYSYSPSATPPPSSASTSSIPAMKSDFTMTGSSESKKIEGIQTDTVLKVSLTTQTVNGVSNSGYRTYSNCVQYKVSISDDQGVISSSKTVTVNTFSADGTGGNCNNVPASPVADFYGQLTRGHGNITVTISNALSDTCGPISSCGQPIWWGGQMAYQPRYYPAPMAMNPNWQLSGQYTISLNGTQ